MDLLGRTAFIDILNKKSLGYAYSIQVLYTSVHSKMVDTLSCVYHLLSLIHFGLTFWEDTSIFLFPFKISANVHSQKFHQKRSTKLL